MTYTWLASALAAAAVGLAAMPAGAAAPVREPSLLRQLADGGWQMAHARTALPPVQQVYAEPLEIQDFVEYAFDGGALRLLVSAAGSGAVFGLLVDTSRPRYRDFAALRSTARYDVVQRGSYALILPIRTIDRAHLDRLLARQWSEADLRRLLGPPSYHWHLHGVGAVGLTYVPFGLSFIQLSSAEPLTGYRLMTDEAELDGDDAPSTSPGLVETTALTRRGRAAFAERFLGQREQIDAALAAGKPSPDGRLIVGHVNFGQTFNSETIVIGERGRPERRYAAPYFTADDDYRWLSARTVLFKVGAPEPGFYTLDASTGAETKIATIPALPSSQGTDAVIAFDISGPHEFWYRTDDGVKHAVGVPSRTTAAARSAAPSR
jgi:hypothetical protein